MMEIKNELYNNVKEAPRKQYHLFSVYKSINIKYSITLREELENLIKMTPFYYNTSSEIIQKLIKKLANCPIKIDFSVEVLKKM